MEKSTLLDVIGNSPRCRVLDFLLTGAGFDYSKTQVAREAGISRTTIEGIWKDLERKGFIKKTRSIANSHLFALDLGNPQVKALAQLELALANAKNAHVGKELVVRAR